MKPVVGIQFLGDRVKAVQWIREGRALLRDCVILAKFRGLSQHRMERRFRDDIHIKVWTCFSRHEILITAALGGRRRGKVTKPYCFANRTVALAEVLSVDGVAQFDDSACEPDMVCSTCIAPDQYPAAYYCTKEITYTIEVCDTDDNYLYFSGIPSTDFTPHCPGERVLVGLHLAEDSPSDVLTNAKQAPCTESFTFPSIFFQRELKHFSILPFVADIKKHVTQEKYSYTQ